MFLNSDQMPSTKTIVSAAASVAATAMLVRSVARDYLPPELRSYIFLKLKKLVASVSSELTLVIEEFDGLNENKLFRAAKLYLETIIPPYVKRLKVTIPKKESKVSLSLEKNEEIVDVFNGAHFKWKFASKRGPAKVLQDPDGFNPVVKSEVKSFELSFHKKHKELVFATYIPHLLEKSKEISKKKKKLKLFTLKHDRMPGRRGDVWQSVNLDHPATFETLALDLDVKRMIMEDLERFVKRKEYYRRVGKAWKRGYLLFGPPGTGKSSLIAAMANFINFDIYDLELTELRGNNELRKLLIATENRSILVVEDIDCSIELQDRLAAAAASWTTMNPNRARPGFNQGTQVTLSGLLNFIDGLWSSCGDERIIVFTTNHKERLDPALLRPGRMDVHVHMSYCTPYGFKMLASNYLGITEHPLLLEIEGLIEQVKVTPAEIGEQLMKNEVPEVALSVLIEVLQSKASEAETLVAVEAEGTSVEVTTDGN